MKQNFSTRITLAAFLSLITLAGQTYAQSVSIRPDRLRDGDGKTRSVTLEASVTPGARLNISVNYTPHPSAVTTVLIPRFVVQDNGSEDRNPQDGNIRLVLPRAFDKTGVYTIQVEETRSVLRLVHEPNNTSYVRQFVDLLVSAAGGGERGSERKSAAERIAEAIKTGGQDKIAIWTAPMPAQGEMLDQQSVTLKIKSAAMPAWSPKESSIACSAWRSGKWMIAAYNFRAGEAIELWQWSGPNDGRSDFSPAWSPDGDAVAFARLNKDQRSDLWILQLDRNGRPKKEVKVTELGNVQGVLGWDKDLGIVFETKGDSTSRQLWALKPTLTATATPLSDAYNMLRGGAPLRGTLIYTQENESPPVSVVYEMNSSGKRSPLLVGDFCSYRWPTVSHDEKWLAFEYNCPR